MRIPYDTSGNALFQPCRTIVMALDFDPSLYQLKYEETEQTIAEKRKQLTATSDPYVIAAIQRTLDALEDMLVIYRKTAEVLEALQQLTKTERLIQTRESFGPDRTTL